MTLRAVVLACAVCIVCGISMPSRSVYILKRSAGMGLGNWKLPFGRPSFLNRDGDEGEEEYISSAHLLPDYLTHQEFLKPQLQKAGFSGGRIVAGPFPVPLSKLPKPPARSGTEEGPQSVPPPPFPSPFSPTASSTVSSVNPSINPTAKPSLAPAINPARVPIVPPFNYQQKLPPTPKPVKYNPKAPLKLLQRPLAALAEAAASMRPNPVRPVPSVQPVQPVPPPVQPVRQVVPQKTKLVYPIPAPTSSNPQWLAAYHSGPETPLSSLGSIKYSLPANPGLAAGDIRLNYGGWTPIYSPATSSIRISKPESQAAVAETEPQPEFQPEHEAPSLLDAQPEYEQEHEQEYEYEQEQEQEYEQEHEQEYEQETGDTETDSGDTGLKNSSYDDVSAGLTTAVNISADVKKTLTQEGDDSGLTVTTTPKRTVRKLRQLAERVKQVDAADTGYYSRQLNEEVPIPVAMNRAFYPTDLEGQGQGRFVGHVLPDYAVVSYDQPPQPSGWGRVAGSSSPPTGYVLHLAH